MKKFISTIYFLGAAITIILLTIAILFRKFCSRKIIFLPSLICLAFLLFYVEMF